MIAAAKEITPRPVIEGLPNVDDEIHFANPTIHSADTNTGMGSNTSWLSSQFKGHGKLPSMGAWNQGSVLKWGSGQNTTQLPQSLRAQPTGM
jgi:hypothetical protein